MVRESADSVSVAIPGYLPDSLAWLAEGRPVSFEGRDWRPVGQPVELPAGTLQEAGEFEGMTLYAPEHEEAPGKRHLFVPLRGGQWQPLEPVDTVR